MNTFEILGKPIRYHRDEQNDQYYSLDDVCALLGLVLKKGVDPRNQNWSLTFTSDNGEEILGINSKTLLTFIPTSPKLEARAYLYRRIHGVESREIGGAFTSSKTMYDARDLAICLGYANDDPAVAQYFRIKKQLPVYGAYKLAVGSSLPDAESFVDNLFDEIRLTPYWTHMKFGPRKNHIIPFVYKGANIRTFAEEEEGGFLFTLDDVCLALGVQKAPSLGRGKGLRKTRVVDYYYGEDEKGTVITEAGLDLLLERVGTPEAEEFGRWVAQKVLPSLKQPHPCGRPVRLVLRDGRWVPKE